MYSQRQGRKTHQTRKGEKMKWIIVEVDNMGRESACWIEYDSPAEADRDLKIGRWENENKRFYLTTKEEWENRKG